MIPVKPTNASPKTPWSFMNLPSVSIIVPVYNVEAYVEDCIRSVMRQTYEGPIECIIVDDCGTDDSMAVVERVIAGYNGPIILKVLHHERNRGLSAARNTGMDAATGDYLFFLDSDDEITEDCLEKLTEPLKIEWYDVLMGDFKKIDMNYNVSKTGQELKIPNKMLLRRPQILRNYRKEWNTMAWNKLYRSSFIKEYKCSFLEGFLYEDDLWGFQIACIASSLYSVNHITYIQKERKGSITYNYYSREKQRDNADSRAVFIKIMKEFVMEHKVSSSDSFHIFKKYFEFVLNNNSSSLSSYKLKYCELRPCFRAPFCSIFELNHFCIRKIVHDIHYLLPVFIAPYLQYVIFYRLYPLIVCKS